MESILVTGFSRFGDYRNNPTEELSKEPALFMFHKTDYMVFPPEVFSEGAEGFGKEIVEAAISSGARAIVSLGMSSAVKGMRIETCAYNWSENSKYGNPEDQKRPLSERFPEKHPLSYGLWSWNLEKIFFSLDIAGFEYESEFSKDPGFFCCNALMFRTILALEDSGCKIPYIFIHVPCTPESVSGLDFPSSNCLVSIEDIKGILSVLELSLISDNSD
jgi:pyrrolidone-carboxylate peptidase